MSELYEINLKSSFKNFSKETKFLVGGSLGRLARFLRIMGYDTIYDETNEERELITNTKAEGRIILTKAQDIAMSSLNTSFGIIKFSSKVINFNVQLALLCK
ncbi:MAG: Mut7-C RNAse domain-containing protein, partial [Candidatus Kariarchaeaceae archaeon]